MCIQEKDRRELVRRVLRNMNQIVTSEGWTLQR
jgi:hypothetical protein